MEISNLCRKLRDFSIKYPTGFSQNNTTKNLENNESKFNLIFKKVKENKKKDNKTNLSSTDQLIVKETSKSTPIQSATPLYQLREFLEAITSQSEDARILISDCNTECSK